nr:hypothetical protein [Tanacetum cinerariifolium]
LEDIPARTGDMVVAEMPKKKVLAEKEKNKRTKRKAETLANEARVSKNAYAGRLDALRNQIDEQSPPHHENVDEHMVDGDAENEHGDENIANEGHSDNTGRHLESVRKPARDKDVVTPPNWVAAE